MAAMVWRIRRALCIRERLLGRPWPGTRRRPGAAGGPVMAAGAPAPARCRPARRYRPRAAGRWGFTILLQGVVVQKHHVEQRGMVDHPAQGRRRVRIDAGVPDQPAFAQSLQCGQQVIVDVVLAGTVQLVDIEVIQAEVAQRASQLAVMAAGEKLRCSAPLTPAWPVSVPPCWRSPANRAGIA